MFRNCRRAGSDYIYAVSVSDLYAESDNVAKLNGNAIFHEVQKNTVQ